MTEYALLEGHISIEAALKARSRPLHVIYASSDKPYERIAYLDRLARAAGVPLERRDPEFVNSRAKGKTHGGVIALAGERQFVSLKDLLRDAPQPFVVMLDGIEDPFNLGYALRSVYAAGADGVVLRPRKRLAVAGIIARASAGASELVPTALADSVLAAATFFKAQGLAVACTAGRKAVPLYDADLTGPLFLLIGGEKRGVTRSFLEVADVVLRIPYGRGFSASLPVASAAATLCFEVMRQRTYAQGAPGEGDASPP